MTSAERGPDRVYRVCAVFPDEHPLTIARQASSRPRPAPSPALHQAELAGTAHRLPAEHQVRRSG